jgi:hypothetical protein
MRNARGAGFDKVLIQFPSWLPSWRPPIFQSLSGEAMGGRDRPGHDDRFFGEE